jgi:integrase
MPTRLSSKPPRSGEQQRIADEVWITTILPQLSLERLRDKSIYDYFYTYQRWSNYLRTVASQGLEQQTPITGTSRCIMAFVENIRARASTTTALIEARRLRRLLLVIDRNLDIGLLNHMINKMHLEAKATQRKRYPNVSTPSLLNLGYDLMRFADERISTENSYAAAISWRDGFMIALLALRPLRICNFVNLRLQDNLFIHHDIAWFRFQTYETKNGQYLELPYPNELFSQLGRYIGKIRPIFIRGTASPYLWLSRRGEPMHEAVLRRIIKTRTNNAFGFAISPHRFRHAAVTYLATTHPEWISFGPDLLGHSDTAVAEAHYNHASTEGAATEVQDHLIDEAKSVHARSARARQTRPPERESRRTTSDLNLHYDGPTAN